MALVLAKKPNQVEDSLFSRYEKVRVTGKYNMVIDAEEARREAGLTDEEYWFVVENYDVLHQRYGIDEEVYNEIYGGGDFDD